MQGKTCRNQPRQLAGPVLHRSAAKPQAKPTRFVLFLKFEFSNRQSTVLDAVTEKYTEKYKTSELILRSRYKYESPSRATGCSLPRSHNAYFADIIRTQSRALGFFLDEFLVE